jgi:hypothetical protein
LITTGVAIEQQAMNLHTRSITARDGIDRLRTGGVGSQRMHRKTSIRSTVPIARLVARALPTLPVEPGRKVT